jgi:hypothetical protein
MGQNIWREKTPRVAKHLGFNMSEGKYVRRNKTSGDKMSFCDISMFILKKSKTILNKLDSE